MTPEDYRALADEYREQGRDADADVCEIMAQEAARLARIGQQPIEIRDDEDDDPPAVVMTKDGPQALLPGMTAPPVQRDAHTQQLTMF